MGVPAGGATPGIQTGSADSKFGMTQDEMAAALEIVAATKGQAIDATGTALRPVRCHVFCHPIDVLDRDHFLAIDHADAAEPDGCDGAGFDRSG